jgi:transposase
MTTQETIRCAPAGVNAAGRSLTTVNIRSLCWSSGDVVPPHARLAGRQRRYIKGQKYTLLSRKENLTLEGRKALKTLLAANKRLNTAYVLKQSFGQLWSYEREGWARRFFENWRASLKWQRLKPYEKFAAMIDRHWDSIAASCRLENKVSLGFVEGLNNKIRVIQRRAYGLRNEDYLRLKILTCMLPAL